MEAVVGPLRGAQPSVELQALLVGIFDNVLSDFAKLSMDGSGQADRESAEQRKYRLLQHLHASRQQLLRALALVNWKPWKVLNELVDHDRVLDIAASHVRTMTDVVMQMRQQAAGRIMAGSYLNMYDVNTALEVLTTGTYQELPSIILQRPPLFQPPPVAPIRQRARLAHVTHLIRMRLVQMTLPPGLKVMNISKGTVVLQAEGLYEAKLTLVPSEPLLGADSRNADAVGRAGEGGGSGCGSRTNWTTACAAAAADPAAATVAEQRWKWRLIHFVLAIGVPFYDSRQSGQILNTCNFHMVLAADNAAYLHRQKQAAGDVAGGGCGAARATTSTISESAATPAPSGLHLPGSAADGGIGGSLEAAVRRTEGDELGAPLAVMHAILTDVAGRLLVDELTAAACSLAAPGSRWHGHIAVKPSQLLHPGVRIEFWTQAPPLLSFRMLPPPAPGGDWRSVKPGPPYVELGMGEGGCVEVLNSPSSLHKPIAASKLRLDTFRVNVEEVLMRAANMSSQFQLLQIRSELKAQLVEAMAKRVGTMRLTSIARQLWCRHGHGLQQPGTEEDELQPEVADAPPQSQSQSQQPTTARDGGGGDVSALGSAADATGGGSGSGVKTAPVDVNETPSVAQSLAPEMMLPLTTAATEISGLLARAAPDEEVAGALVVLSAPVLEYLVSGTTELKIGKHLFSGRLTLRPGQDERDEGSLDHAATIAMNEDYVNQAALVAYNTAPDSYPALRALKEACKALCTVLQRTHTSTDATHFIQAARRAALHISRLPHGMLEAFNGITPGLAIEPRSREKVATWSLQCLPFPPNFPPLEPVAPDTLPLRVPQCMTFFLQSRLSLTSPHVLVVCSCNKQLMPIKVLSCIPVPASTYRLPDHVVAAYMAVSTAGHSTGTSTSGGGGSNNSASANSSGRHPSPHSAYSPRLLANGHDPAGGHSPEASPLRDSTVGAGVGTGGLQWRPAVSSAIPPLASDSAVGSASQVSGVPPLPASQSLSLSHSHSHGRTQSAGMAASGSHPPHGGGSGGASRRPTGQQVAVMLAQQQLSSVVRWCRRRMVWEVLLAQLKAVGATHVELWNPPSQQVRIATLAGTALPCHIARRRGLLPPHVGPTSVELELGPDALAGQVTARMYGRFLCAPSCAPLDRRCGGGGARGGSGRQASTAAAGFVLDEELTWAQRSGGAGGGIEESGLVCLRRQYCLERGESALTLVQEVSAIIRMQTLLARLEMTARPVAAKAGTTTGSLGAVQVQRLAVLAPSKLTAVAAIAKESEVQAVGTVAVDGLGLQQELWSPNHLKSQQQQQQGGTCSLQAGNGEDVCGQRPGSFAGNPAGYHSMQQPAAKRLKTELACPYGNGDWGSWQQQQGQQQRQQQQQLVGFAHPSSLANGSSDGHQGIGGPAQAPFGHGGLRGGLTSGAVLPPSVLTWHWPLVGTLNLEEYSCNSATLRVSPCTSGSRESRKTGGIDTSHPTAMPPPPLLLQFTWAPRDALPGGGGGAGVGVTPGAGVTPTPIHSSVINMPSPAVGANGPLTPPPPLQPLVTLQRESAVRPTRQGPQRSSGESFGCLFSDLVLCTVSCSSGHSLPADYLQALEELAEAGEEGKVLDAVAVAAWPVAGFCAALSPAVLARHGLLPDLDVRLTMQQPPYCLRIVCRKRSATVGTGSPVLIDLICQAVGRSYLKISAPPTTTTTTTAAAQQQQQLQAQTNSPDSATATKGDQTISPAAAAGQDTTSPSHTILSYVQHLVLSRLGDRGVHVSVGGRGSVYTGLGQRPAAVPGPGAPLWLLVPTDCVQQAVELVFCALI